MLPGHARARKKDGLLTGSTFNAPKGRRPSVVCAGDVSLISPTEDPLHRRSPSIPLDSIETNHSCHTTRGETRPRLARILDHPSQDFGEGGSTALDTSRAETTGGETTTVVHRVSRIDSLPSVALRYGVSVAALRRANNLWPSDPIYLRTELKIPCGDPLSTQRKLTSVEDVDAASPEPPSRSSSDSLSTLTTTVGDAILSMFPARASLDSLLSSRTSSSEVLELGNLVAMRASRSVSGARHVSITRDGYELSILGNQSRAPVTTTLPPLPCVATSSAVSASANVPLHCDTARRIDPTVFIPVRMSQLEPEPAMELPIRRHG
ncbi:hypothetical protein F5J12DRAFT_949556 [Pisolithus orientalis]|uniref:uncharacterized protein n=1 Tax=Pisolithus orientalis TaxID=936130 RepID=UPI0022242B1F|nr:uncharacterized protein F5J12DRAFT_949556 [Pisolithus orientalis]KAI6001633.1 hypothetical protein F5J12DRAFT_949556 [Pisolithus orientalis]